MSRLYDLIIVGAGPAGLSAGLRARELKLGYLILERSKICNTLSETYIFGKTVTDFPKEMPVKGNFWFKRCKVEVLLEKWREIAKNLVIQEGEEVVKVSKKGEIFQVRSNKDIYESRAVIMAVGKEGKSKKLGVRGEGLDKVFYKLKEGKEIKGKNVLVVGGGDSAVEVAICLCGNKRVTLSYRGVSFFRLNEENLRQIEDKDKRCEINVVFKSNVKEIKEKTVILDVEGKEREFENDLVLIFAGSELPINFLKKSGVKIEKDKVKLLDERFQTSVKNLFVVGDASGKPPYLIKPAINQGYEVVNFIKSSFIN